VAAVGILVLLMFLAAIAADAALARIGGGPLTTTGATSGQETAAAQDWVVKPGDTIWSIAEAIDPRGDVRPLVDRLSAEVGNAPLYPGEVIQLPASR
jgi:LysM domain